MGYTLARSQSVTGWYFEFSVLFYFFFFFIIAFLLFFKPPDFEMRYAIKENHTNLWPILSAFHNLISIDLYGTELSLLIFLIEFIFSSFLWISYRDFFRWSQKILSHVILRMFSYYFSHSAAETLSFGLFVKFVHGLFIHGASKVHVNSLTTKRP